MADRRFNIGLLAANITDDFSRRFSKGAMEGAKEFDVNLIIFPGKYLGLQHKYLQYDTQYEYQYNVLFDHAAEGNFDYLIAAVGTIAYTYDNDQKKEFLDALGNTPTLCVASEIDGYDFLQFDNVSGITSAVDYLAKTGRKHIAMMAGDLNNLDCIQRYDAYRKALEKNHLEFKESYMVCGAFSQECVGEAKELIEKNPELDAIICANDVMALTVCDVLKEKGIEIGRQTAVVGFDDLPDSAQSDPPLASIKADAELLGKRAVEKAVNFLKGIKDNAHYIDTEFVPRASALKENDPEKPQETQENFLAQKQAYKKIIEKYAQRSHLDNIFIRDALMFGGDIKDSYAKILKRLCNVGAMTAFIYTLEKPVEHNYGDVFPKEATWDLRSYSYGAEVFTVENSRRKMTTPQIFDNEYLCTNRQHIFIAADLYTAQTQYGLALLEPKDPDFFDELELVTYQLSSAVRTLDILNRQERLLDEIHAKNLALDKMSRIDELTKVYNRRGFYPAAEALINSAPGKVFLICYADMDGLKMINDVYGHAEGDLSIKKASECLSAMFGKNAVVGRMGGDEFAAVTLKTDDIDAAVLRSRKKEFADNFNTAGKKPYKFDISLGIAECECFDSYDLKAAMDKADDLLYVEKNNKKFRK